MKLKLLLIEILLTTTMCLAQDHDSLKGKTWVCTSVKSKMIIDTSNYLNQSLKFLKGGKFNFIQNYEEVGLINEINGTYQISKNGEVKFPSSKLVVTMNGSTDEVDCIYMEKGDKINLCMLDGKIKILNKSSFTITYKGSEDSEIREDLILTYTLK